MNTEQNHRSEESLEERPRLFLSGVLGKSDHCIPEFGLHHLFNYLSIHGNNDQAAFQAIARLVDGLFQEGWSNEIRKS